MLFIFFLQAILCPLDQRRFQGRPLARISSSAVAEQSGRESPDWLNPPAGTVRQLWTATFTWRGFAFSFLGSAIVKTPFL
jgi:hypothetical protein